MITLQDIQGIISSTFTGDMTTAGLIMFVAVALIVFGFIRKIWASTIVMMPIVLLFSMMGVLSNDMTIILIIVLVLCLAATARTAAAGEK